MSDFKLQQTIVQWFFDLKEMAPRKRENEPGIGELEPPKKKKRRRKRGKKKKKKRIEWKALKQPCKFYMEGRCQKGDECTFRHEGVDIIKRLHEPCKFLLAGGCDKGDLCAYQHDLSLCPCKFFHLYGSCKEGDNCQWNHDELDEEAIEAFRDRTAAMEISTEEKEIMEIKEKEEKEGESVCSFNPFEHANVVEESQLG
mmetsp:Transcript_11030/g.16241  ORF Transcript_11030/g.16241 Transcript_11030/m.16241 type:complete len:199 (+) Transcript_11030:2089-2685(+)